MSYSSIAGGSSAPKRSKSKSAAALGPSDNSDSGSDAAGTSEERADSDAGGAGERSSVDPQEAAEGADIGLDRMGRSRSARSAAPWDGEDEGEGLDRDLLDLDDVDVGELMDLAAQAQADDEAG